ncbi:MAG: hypothetical protein NC928_03975 [Candidatus Omnitrophica bacterium]|nr:hypothetical protein [Candidatus Omnitrophota bacterium]
MFLILFFTLLGFLVGLIYIMYKRRIRLGKFLTVTILGLILACIQRIFKDQFKDRYL